MAKVYVVTSGAYAEYGIDAVFSTREKAEAYIARLGYYERGGTPAPRSDAIAERDERIEEYDLDIEPGPERGGFACEIDGRGQVSVAWGSDDIIPQAPAEVEISNLSDEVLVLFAQESGREPDLLALRVRFLGYGTTPEHARRSAEECRRQWVTRHMQPGSADAR